MKVLIDTETYPLDAGTASDADTPDGRSLHICFFVDQHPRSLGGLQTSVALQRRFLERAGHRVTVVTPRTIGRIPAEPGVVEVPAIPVARTGYAAMLPSSRLDTLVDRAVTRRGPVDIVHLQGDVWGAWLGKRYARRHRIPYVLTTHTNVEGGLRAVLGQTADAALLGMTWWQSHVTGDAAVRSGSGIGYDYLRALAAGATAVVAPSKHFAERLRRSGIQVSAVVPTGVDDEAIRAARRTRNGAPARDGAQERDADQPVRMVWLGRFSKEKRPLELIEALSRIDAPVVVDLYGAGPLVDRVGRLVRELGLSDRVRLRGVVTHEAALRAIAAADLVVQTSIGFETQGMTVYEALALGVPVVVRDPDIAAEIGGDGRRRPWGWYSATPGAAGLAQTLDAAARTVRERTAPTVPDQTSAALLQSVLSRRMQAVYADALSTPAVRR